MKVLSLHLMAVALLALLGAPAQEIREGLPRPKAAATNAPAAVEQIEVSADQMEYFQDKQLIIGRGHVVLEHGRERLFADYVRANTLTQIVEARGNITLEREGAVWRGEELTYNFRTHQGDFGAFVAFYDPLFVRADEAQRVSTNKFVLHNVTLTTCDGDSPQFLLRAGEAHIINGATIETYDTVPYLFGIPFFWLPYWQRSLDPELVTFYFVPGYSSRMGPFALTGYGYHLGAGVRGVTHVDPRTLRGVGLGQDVLWKDPAPAKKFEGKARAYWMYDADPFFKEEDEVREGTTTNQRYRLQLQHRHTLSSRDALMGEVNYLSDPYVIEDFFDDEFRHSVQPENRLTLMHRGDAYAAGLQVNGRVNDFYENINRLPEATLEINQLKVAGTPFYYESQNSAGFLQHVYPGTLPTNAPPSPEDYDAFRLDTAHTLYLPTRSFGFLNIIPRARYEGTLYSKTYSVLNTTNVTVLTNQLITATGTNTVLTSTNAVMQTLREQGAGMRHLPQLGAEASFKAFKVLGEGPTGIGRDVGLRHVAEPYLNYTFQPTPNLEPTALPQFDALDALTLQHDVQLGMRNKVQTKRRGYVHNLVDCDLYTYYRLENPPGITNDFSDVYTLTRLRPLDWLMVDFDAAFDPYQTQFSFFNTQVALLNDDESRLAFEYRYTKDNNNLIAGELMLFPRERWSFRAYVRYDLDNQNIQEQSYLVQHKNDCLGIGVGVRQLDNDTTLWLQIWLSAFPQLAADLGR
jgi:LPS-assembly protein